MKTVVKGDWFATLIDADGETPCNPPDACEVCALFDGQRPDETRVEWLARITELTPERFQEAS